jgi:hypothetical protein
MSAQYRLVQSGKTASGGYSAGQGSSEPVAPRIYLFIFYFNKQSLSNEVFFWAISCDAMKQVSSLSQR